MIDPMPTRRLVIVVRADPVICGHSGEARNLAEAALQRGYDDVRIVTWPIEALGALPLKPLASVLPYSPGIVVERPEPVGDYKVPDGRFTGGMVGRLVELFTDGVPTVCISLYLTPHASVVVEALAVCRAMGIEPRVTTIAEAVGSDITNVVRSCVEQGRFGAAAHTFTSFLAHDHCVAVSQYTLDCIIAAADDVDAGWGTSFGQQCRERVGISYPAIDCHGTAVDDAQVVDTLARRGLERDRYVLFLSRISPEKGVDDLIDGYARSAASDVVPLVIAGTGPALAALRERAGAVPCRGPHPVPRRRRRRREVGPHGRLRDVRPAEQGHTGVRRDLRDRPRGEDARRWRHDHHHRHRGHPGGRRSARHDDPCLVTLCDRRGDRRRSARHRSG